MYAPLNLANEQRTLTRNEYRIFTDFINDKYEDTNPVIQWT